VATVLRQACADVVAFAHIGLDRPAFRRKALLDSIISGSKKGQ
jgi:hypothetical protein